MISRCDKIDFVSAAKIALNDADMKRLENFLLLAKNSHYYLEEGEVCPDSNKPTETEFFDYLYCLIRVCDYDIDKFLRSIKVRYPIEVIMPLDRVELAKEEFERIVYVFFNRYAAEDILKECSRYVASCLPQDIPSEYGRFYLLLFVCDFHKETFMRNLADHYQLKPYIDNVVLKEMQRFKVTFPEVESIEQQIKAEIDKRKSAESYSKSIRDRYDESPEHYEEWSSEILSAVSSDRFATQLAWLIYDIFPEKDWNEYNQRVASDQSLLAQYQYIASLQQRPDISQVTIDLKNSSNKIKIQSPQLLRTIGHSLQNYVRVVEGIDADVRVYEKEIALIKEKLEVRLLRRTALLLCHYGLYHESDDNDESYDMWFLDSGKKHFVKFGAKYGSLIFDLLKSVDKCEKVLFDFDRKGKNKEHKMQYGVNPTSNKGKQISKKAKWDSIKYRLKKTEGWQKEEIQINDIPLIPVSLKMYNV